ncbi:MAG: hypothetical protein JJU31_12680 [Wenzhouxiangella sp.]|nr:hypothetical protein [Wenzhouxiangella sp.]MCH8477490.1 hypothetical protein [Wenzhouxiangella sp.]TVR94294.1 MAG: hypothetical protein EA418_10455 [Wenzhouxiangellaceae bacterium]
MIDKSRVIQLIAMVRLGRTERLHDLVTEASATELAKAMTRLQDDEHLALLDAMDEPTRQATLLALDYVDWMRLIDSAGPFNRHLIGCGDSSATRARS